jgi:hypothetical protein
VRSEEDSSPVIANPLGAKQSHKEFEDYFPRKNKTLHIYNDKQLTDVLGSLQ